MVWYVLVWYDLVWSDMVCNSLLWFGFVLIKKDLIQLFFEIHSFSLSSLGP